MATWTALPREVLVMIFDLLGMKDLVSASSVCQVWRCAYEDPYLWRSRTFQFAGLSLSYPEYVLYLDQYSQHFGRYLQHLHIVCDTPDLVSAHKIAQCVHRLLTNLAMICPPRASLKSITINHLNFERTWDTFRTSKYLLMESFTEIFKLQHDIKHIDFSYDLLPWKHAQLITLAIVRSQTANNIETLNFHDFYSHMAPRLLIHSDCMGIFQSCCNLKVIFLNYDYLDVATLQCACQNLSTTLKKLHLLVSYRYREHHYRRNPLDPKVWQSVSELCPKLRVSVTLNYWPLDPTAFLVECTPLEKISISGWHNLSSCIRVTELLNHLARFFSSSLTKAIVLMGLDTAISCVPLKKVLENFLAKCSCLRYVEFSEALVSQKFVESVGKNFAKDSRGCVFRTNSGILHSFSYSHGVSTI